MPNIPVMQSMLPSVTRMGMAALLPHRVLTIIDDDHALVDDMLTIDLKQREAVLQKENASVEPSSTMTSRV